MEGITQPAQPDFMFDLFGVPLARVLGCVPSQQTNADFARTEEWWEEQHRRAAERGCYAPANSKGTIYAKPEETAFRHGGWAVHRAAVRAALVRGGFAGARVERFDNCGGGCVVEASMDTGELRIRGNYCGDRFCEPCSVARSKHVAEELLCLMEGKRCSFLTIAPQHTNGSLCQQIAELEHAFRCLRQTALWKSRVVGGAKVLEIKIEEADRCSWHPHLHILLEGSYLPHADLVRLLEKSLKRSCHVYIEPAVPGRHVRYLCKYVGKAIDGGVVDSPGHLDVALRALSGRRVCDRFGAWRGAVPLPDKPAVVWKPICSLAWLVSASASGDQWAARTLAVLLSKRSGEVDVDLGKGVQREMGSG